MVPEFINIVGIPWAAFCQFFGVPGCFTGFHIWGGWISPPPCVCQGTFDPTVDRVKNIEVLCSWLFKFFVYFKKSVWIVVEQLNLSKYIFLNQWYQKRKLTLFHLGAGGGGWIHPHPPKIATFLHVSPYTSIPRNFLNVSFCQLRFI